MIVNKNIFLNNNNSDYSDNQRGASIIEILLSMGIIVLISPFIYNQITNTVHDIQDVSLAKKITDTRASTLNFLRMNQEAWPDIAEIKLDSEELVFITNLAHSGFIDKYQSNGISQTDVYLAFTVDNNMLHSAKIAEKVGSDAAVVGKDGIAYGDSWAVAAPEFKSGDIVYRIERNFSSDDNSKYLHRSTSGEDKLNVMQRNLDMGKFDIYNIGTFFGKTGTAKDTYAAFVNIKDFKSTEIYFSGGANMDGSNVNIKSIKVNDDITGFKNINAKKLNNDGFSGTGNIIADRATISKSLNVGNNLNIKSDSEKTISGFVGISTHALYVPYLSTDELTFYNNFGLTVSGELLLSTTSPIKFGSWYFPNITPPSFSVFNLSQVAVPKTPDSSDFDKLINSGWKD